MATRKWKEQYVFILYIKEVQRNARILPATKYKKTDPTKCEDITRNNPYVGLSCIMPPYIDIYSDTQKSTGKKRLLNKTKSINRKVLRKITG